MITYQCETCGTERTIQNTKSQESERLTQPCQECGDVTCFELAEDLPEEIDEKARDMLRAVNQTVLMKTNYTGNKHIHIKNGDGPLCGDDADMREVPVQAFPNGYYA